MKECLHQWGLMQGDPANTDMYLCPVCGEIRQFDEPPKFECFECGDIFTVDSHEFPYTRNNEIICDVCFDDGQSPCAECGEFFEIEDMACTDDECSDQRCPKCYAKWQTDNKETKTDE